MTPADTQRVLATLLAAYPHATVDPPTALIWNDHLRDIPADDGLAVARSLIRTSRFFPTISEYRDAWTAYRRVATGAYPALVPADDRLTVEEVRNRLNQMRDRLGGGGLSRPDAPRGGNPEPEETT